MNITEDFEDTTLCRGTDCPAAKSCRRYSKMKSKKNYFYKLPPFKFEFNKFSCDKFVGDPAAYLLVQLISIYKKK